MFLDQFGGLLPNLILIVFCASTDWGVILLNYLICGRWFHSHSNVSFD